MKKVCIWVGMSLIVQSLFIFGQNAEKMDKLFDLWNRQDQPGLAAIVVKDGQVVYQKVFGLACQEHGVAVSPKTVFNIATAAQPFVGMAVAMLEDEGKLSLDDDVRKYIPEIPDFGTPVRLRHLLYQTSGLRDWLPVLQMGGRDKEEVTFDQIMRIIKAQKQLAFPPGDRFQDSNSNYDLLAETIKRATGRPFSDWAWENMFKPLKMARTQFRDNFRSILDDQAFSYNFTRSEYLKGIDTLSLTGSHSLFASIDDLGKWLLNLEAGQVAGEGIFARTFASGRLNNGQTSGFGYGWKVEDRPERRQVSRVGNWAGSLAALVYFPDHKLGFAVLQNWDWREISLQSIADIYLPAPAAPVKKSPPGQTAPKIVPVKPTPHELEEYAGSYFNAELDLRFAVELRGDMLIVNAPGQNAIRMAPYDKDRFTTSSAIIPMVVFQRDGHNLVTGFIIDSDPIRDLVFKNQDQ